jgi:hypothetical protein
MGWWNSRMLLGAVEIDFEILLLGRCGIILLLIRAAESQRISNP